MVLQGQGAQVKARFGLLVLAQLEARFGLFRDSANLDAK